MESLKDVDDEISFPLTALVQRLRQRPEHFGIVKVVAMEVVELCDV